MTKPLTIQQWFARAKDIGIIPDYKNIWAELEECSKMYLVGSYDIHDYQIWQRIDASFSGNRVQLRKDGVDSVELWTKEDIPKQKDFERAKEAWFLINYDNVSEISLMKLDKDFEPHHQAVLFKCCLLASHGQIAPKPEDFKKVYGEV